MPSVPFCDLNDQFSSSPWEMKYNKNYLENEKLRKQGQGQGQQQAPITNNPQPIPNPVIQPSSMLRPQNQQPQNYPSPTGTVALPTFTNSLSCNNRNNTFQTEVQQRSTFRDRVPIMNGSNNLDAQNWFKPAIPMPINNRGNYGNYGIEHFGNVGIRNPVYELFKTFDNTDKTLQITIILLVLLLVIQIIEIAIV
jgi:hypothetical protein